MNPAHQPQWKGKFLQVIKAGRWEYADRLGTSGAVAILALTPEGKVLLTEQYRLPVKCRVIELPAGLAGDTAGNPAEPMAAAARRELLEETGYAAETLTCLAAGPPSAGLASEIVSFFLAIGLRRTSPGGGDGTEDIQVHEVPLTEIDQWLLCKTSEGVLVDPKVYAGLYLAHGSFQTRTR